MKKIFQYLFILLSAEALLVSCMDYDDAPNTIPEIPAPYIVSITEKTAKVYMSDYLLVSVYPDMSDAVQYSPVSEEYYEKYRGETVRRTHDVVNITGLVPNKTYYAQTVRIEHCWRNDAAIKSPTTEFKTKAYAPTSYSIYLNSLPVTGDYGVFTTDANGGCTLERINGNMAMNPQTKITDKSMVYIYAPYTVGATSPTSVPIHGGQDFCYGVNNVSPDSPKLYINPVRYTAHVTVNVTFIKETDDEPLSLTLKSLSLANASGNSPICGDGTFDLTTEKFTPSASGRTSYSYSTSYTIKNNANYSRTFAGIIPVKFNDKEVNLNLKLDGNIVNNEVSLPIPAQEWKEGSDVTINLKAGYTAKDIELTLQSITVNQWQTGSTGNIEIIK